MIDEFVKRFRDVTDAPEMFIRASCYHLLSYFPGRYCYSSYGRKIKPNIFVLLSCVPGRGRRSTIANWNGDITRKVLEALYGEDGASEVEAKEIIEDGTPEGISDHVVQTKTKHLDIRSTEFGSVLEKMKETGYAYGLSSFYSRLYYGEQYSQHLSKRKDGKQSRFIPRGMYTTMFSGMQEPYLFIKSAMIREGLIRRIILCYIPVEKLSYWKPPLDDRIYGKVERATSWAADLIEERYMYYKGIKVQPVDIVFDDEAIKIINEYGQKYESLVHTTPGDLSIYLQSTWEQLSKLSMLECIGRKGVLVTKDDVSKALLFYLPVLEQSEDVINSLAEERPIVTIKSTIDRVFTAVSGKGKITRTDLYRKMNMSRADLDDALAVLLEQKRIAARLPLKRGDPIIYEIT